ncbi:LysR family transcriptional regulator [Variovorax sp. HW608]|uniref:LysR family transcriptional regulator n=1 Tax=Variovorax sp. HW608 TaxID=1034889 RepID=UPI0012FD5595|nr:LysR family transcriptional regulator [Variovorax sp. HW608]
MSSKTSLMHRASVVDLNDLRVFAYVASLSSFSLAADALKIHKSSVSRSVLRLEMVLQTPLIERTTRRVELTSRGKTLKRHTVEILSRVEDTLVTIKSMSI